MENIFVSFKTGEDRWFYDVVSETVKIPENGVFLLFKMKGGETASILLDSIRYIVEVPKNEEEDEDIH